MIRVPVEGIRVSGRNTQGVKVMNLASTDLVVDVARVVKEDEAANGADEEETDGSGAAKGKSKTPPKARARKK